jgi:hypothetical protein
MSFTLEIVSIHSECLKLGRCFNNVHMDIVQKASIEYLMLGIFGCSRLYEQERCKFEHCIQTPGCFIHHLSFGEIQGGGHILTAKP